MIIHWICLGTIFSDNLYLSGNAMVSCRLVVNNLNDTEILSESWRMLNQEMKASAHHKLNRPMFGFMMVLIDV